jgi:hypothetical protein
VRKPVFFGLDHPSIIQDWVILRPGNLFFSFKLENLMHKKLLATLLCLATPAAYASLFDFSYTSNINGTLAGQMVGTLQADNNTVVVTSILGFATLNGIAGPSLPYLNSTDFLNFATPNLSPKVTLDGSFMDFIASHGPNGSNDAFTFNAGNLSAATYGTNGAPFYATGGFYSGGFGGGGFGENFIASNWHLSSVNPIPEPEEWAMMLAGFGMVGYQIRRKQKDAVTR